MSSHKKPAPKAKEPQFTKLATAAAKMKLTEHEAVTVLQSSRARPQSEAKNIPLSTKSFSFGYFSDAHIGHEKFADPLFDYMVKFFRQEKPDFILNPGDHLEGMSGRPGHVYELSQVGFKAQFNKARELYSRLDAFDHYGIDGNHDQWYYKKHDMGIVVGDHLERNVKNYHNLGQDEGWLNINGIKIQLIHAGDGTAYATSYKLQKRVEAFSGGEKPNIILSGHYHKAMYMFSRGIHALECGTLCGQTGFMRGKGIQAHMGFGVVKVTYNARGVERFAHEFVPWYAI